MLRCCLLTFEFRRILKSHLPNLTLLPALRSIHRLKNCMWVELRIIWRGIGVNDRIQLAVIHDQWLEPFFVLLKSNTTLKSVTLDVSLSERLLEHLLITQGTETVQRWRRSDFEWSGNLRGIDEQQDIAKTEFVCKYASVRVLRQQLIRE